MEIFGFFASDLAMSILSNCEITLILSMIIGQIVHTSFRDILL